MEDEKGMWMDREQDLAECMKDIIRREPGPQNLQNTAYSF
jgi:hypothetical protein